MIWWQIPEDDLFSVKFLSGYGLQFHSMIKRWSKEWNLSLFRRTRTVGKAIMYKLNLESKQGFYIDKLVFEIATKRALESQNKRKTRKITA